MRHASELHQRAMEFVDRSLLARAGGDGPRAAELLGEAYETESRAALAVVDEGEVEPTRSVLLRSAASLALEVNEAGMVWAINGLSGRFGGSAAPAAQRRR